jgi:hypothetical protein
MRRSLLTDSGRGDDVDGRRAQIVDSDVDDLGHRIGLGLPQQVEDRRHLQHGAQGAAMDRRQERVADKVVVIAHAGQKLAGAVLRRDPHPARIGDRLGQPCHLTRFAHFGQALEQRAHGLVTRPITSPPIDCGRVTSPLVPNMKVPAAAAIGSLASP